MFLSVTLMLPYKVKKVRKILVRRPKSCTYYLHSFPYPPHPRIMSSLVPCDRDRELVNSSVCVPMWRFRFRPLAQKHSQNSDKNIQEPGEKIAPNIVCRNMCQRHQNWFANIWLEGRRRRYRQRLVRTVS